MLAIFVDFEFDDDARERISKVAVDASPIFEGMPGLRSKTFTVDPAGRRATNFYVWDDEEAGRGFFTDDLIEQVVSLYGVRPTLRYADIVGYVSNEGRARS